MFSKAVRQCMVLSKKRISGSKAKSPRTPKAKTQASSKAKGKARAKPQAKAKVYMSEGWSVLCASLEFAYGLKCPYGNPKRRPRFENS